MLNYLHHKRKKLFRKIHRQFATSYSFRLSHRQDNNNHVFINLAKHDTVLNLFFPQVLVNIICDYGLNDNLIIKHVDCKDKRVNNVLMDSTCTIQYDYYKQLNIQYNHRPGFLLFGLYDLEKCFQEQVDLEQLIFMNMFSIFNAILDYNNDPRRFIINNDYIVNNSHRKKDWTYTMLNRLRIRVRGIVFVNNYDWFVYDHILKISNIHILWLLIEAFWILLKN